MNLPELVIFDLDGTLIDSVADLQTALNALLHELGRPSLTIAEVRPMIGDGVGKLVERALVARPGGAIEGAAAVARFLEIYEAAPAALTRPYPGVPETLITLRERGLKLALCTNKPEDATLKVLGALSLDNHFGKIVTGSSFPWRKPDPRLIEAILEAFAIAPDRALYVGDSEVDAALASAAGVPFVLVTYGYHRGSVDAIACEAAIDRFSELIRLIERTS